MCVFFFLVCLFVSFLFYFFCISEGTGNLVCLLTEKDRQGKDGLARGSTIEN